MRRELSLRTKLLLVISAVTAGGLVAASLLSLWADVRTFREDARETGVVTARVVSGYVVPELAFRDVETATESLSKLATIPSLEAAFLYDEAGEPFVSFGADPAPPAPASAMSQALFRDDGLHVIEPVVHRDETYGMLYLRFGTGELRRKIQRNVMGSLAILLFVVLLAVALAWRLQRIVSAPILDLARAARRISITGDYSVRVPPGGHDEIGTLRESFNDMLDQIQDREQERDEAEHRTQEKSRFLANMSHELRTPLNSIIGFSEILLERHDEEDRRSHRFLENIHTSGRHLLSIINDILDLSKVEAGRMELHLQEVDPREVVQGVALVMRGMGHRQQIELELVLPDPLPRVVGDPIKLKQILYNLVANAVKFSPDGGTVRIEAEVVSASRSALGEPSLVISVADRGIGIPPEELERIFEAFHQVDPSRTRRFTGTGLGLALTQRFVEMHQGTLRVESEPGEGSTFRVYLPLRDLRESTDSGGIERFAPLVLVVEDDPVVVEELSRVLEQAGFEPLIARDGDAAVDMARSARPDAVTLDLLLPGRLDGFDVLRRLKSDEATADVPIVIVSRLENQELGFALGADDYFLKPVDLDRMVSRLRQLVSGAREPKVLLIDEDPVVHELLEGTLGKEGYQVIHARTGAEGLARARELRPRVALVAMTLEAPDAFTVVDELGRDPATAGTAVVLLGTHELDDEARRRLMSSVAALLVRHGESGPALVERLRQLLVRGGG